MKGKRELVEEEEFKSEKMTSSSASSSNPEEDHKEDEEKSVGRTDEVESAKVEEPSAKMSITHKVFKKGDKLF